MATYAKAIILNIISSKITVPRAIEMDRGSITCSTITRVGGNSNSTGVLAGSISITNSSIFNFYIGLSIYIFSEPMGNIINSNFYNNSLYNIQNLGDLNVNAIGNWWGTQTNIEDKLYDNWDNIRNGEIFFNNYAPSQIKQQC
jgi:hypothetical protein